MVNKVRRYDIDWLRVLALSLLIIYHIAVIFQPWAYYIYFIQSERPIEIIWLLMGLINIWRIPLLFIISGMGVCFAIRRRDWKELLKERTKRILLPLIFGSFCIVPIYNYIYQKFNQLEHAYWPNTGHLWFLSNIFIYVLLLCPVFFYMKKNPNNLLFRFLKRALKFPGFLYLFVIPFIIEAELVAPAQGFATYANTAHGFWLGLLAFFTGFAFISLGEVFWQTLEKIKGFALVIAIPLFLVRMIVFQLGGPLYLIVIESWSWLFAVFGFGSSYLNHPSGKLSYLSKAVYPVYILHMIFMNLAAYLILSQPESIEKISTLMYIDEDSPAQVAGLLVGDQIKNVDSLQFEPGVSVSINISRKGDELWLSVTPDSSGIIGIHFVPVPLFVPEYRLSETTIFTAAIQFILINIMTFAGSLLCYEFIVKRMKWFRPFFGLKIK